MSKIPTSPDEVLASLTELSTCLYDGLAVGSIEVRSYFEKLAREKGRPVEINKGVATTMMRYHALMHAHESRKKVGAAYHIEDVPFNGLSFRYEWCHVKAYKGMGGEPPTAHKTRRNQAFYSHNQKAAIQPKLKGINWRANWQHADWELIAPTLDLAHFIYCWEVDEGYNLTSVQLFAPRESGKYKQGVKLFWRRPVPHPILGITGLPTVNDEQDVDDLPVYFEDAGEQGEDD